MLPLSFTPLINDLVQTYGLWLVFAIIMLESMGVPMPGETALISASLYVGTTHHIGIVTVIGVAATAAILGDNLGYLVGRKLGLHLLQRYGRYIRLNPDRLKVGQYLYLQHGGKIVFFGRFIALLRAFSALLAGVNQMLWPKFLLMNALGGVCWAALIGGGAYLFGEQIRLVAVPAGLTMLAAVVVLTVIGVIFFRHHEQELEVRAREYFPDDL